MAQGLQSCIGGGGHPRKAGMDWQSSSKERGREVAVVLGVEMSKYERGKWKSCFSLPIKGVRNLDGVKTGMISMV